MNTQKVTQWISRLFLKMAEASPENDLDGLIWPVFRLRQQTLMALQPVSCSMSYSYRRELWRFYWALTDWDKRREARSLISALSQPLSNNKGNENYE